MKSKQPFFLTVSGLVCLLLGTFLSTANAQTDSARQLQQIEPVKAWPSKAKRWALVIGVDKYTDPQISPLKGSDNDARLIADALVRYAGFPPDQVILLSTDQPAERQPTRVNILRRLTNLSAAVPKDGLLLISFAGHGMERSGQAFLLPSDAQISEQISFLEDTAISMSRVKDRIRDTGVGQVLFLLDACRNDPGGRADAPNPLTSAYANAFNFDVRNREVQAFATVYATGIGQRAYEYTEKKQGYFSWALVEGLKGAAANDNGEVTLSQLIRYVQETVPKRIAIDLGSTKQQKPFAIIEGYRAEELVIAVTSSASMPAASTTPAITTVDPAAIELSFWDSIKSSTNPDDFKAYLDKYPDGQFASLAKLRAQPARPASGGSDSASIELTYWNAIKDSRSAADFKAYLAKFPSGVFADLASSRLSALETEERERAAIRELSVDDTTWLGYMKGKETLPGLLGTPITVEFLRGGIFTATYNTVVTVPGFLIDDYKTETVKMAGTWRQEGDLISVQVAQPAAEVIRLSLAANKIQGGSVQGTYNFDIKKLLSRPASSKPCDFRGFSMAIRYRQKDKIDRVEDANKLAARLRSYGMEVDVEKLNNKDVGTVFYYFNGQGNIANLISECVKDALAIKVADGGKSANANQFTIWLQQ